MPDFDATEGYAEASDRRADARSQDAGACPPEVEPAPTVEDTDAAALDPFAVKPIARRARKPRHFISPRSGAGAGRRVSLPSLHRRRRLARQACERELLVLVLATPRRRRRLLSTRCHRRPPGALS
jgi:hypothetical protein